VAAGITEMVRRNTHYPKNIVADAGIRFIERGYHTLHSLQEHMELH